MSGLRRIIRPGTLIHVISRLVVGVTIDDAEERLEYLRRVRHGIERSDWNIISFAIMSTHTHLGLIAGIATFDALFRGVHGAFARWLNRRRGRFGPVFTDRPTTVVVDLANTVRFVAYLHNNPVRAGLVRRAVESDWTSHRFYVNAAPAPDWLDVGLGCHLLGLPDTPEARMAFDRRVDNEAGQDEPWLSGRQLAAHRAEIRRERGSAIEIAYPKVSLRHPREARYPLVNAEGVRLKPRWSGDVPHLLQEVSRQTRVSVIQMQSSVRQRDVTAARCLAVLTYRDYLGRPLNDIARWLGLSKSAASKLAKRASQELHDRARMLAQRVAVEEAEPVFVATQGLAKKVNKSTA